MLSVDTEMPTVLYFMTNECFYVSGGNCKKKLPNLCKNEFAETTEKCTFVLNLGLVKSATIAA